MKAQDKALALEIITSNNNIKVSFNTPVTDNYSNVYEILIHESNSSVLSKLIEAGFSLSMSAKGLVVNKFL